MKKLIFSTIIATMSLAYTYPDFTEVPETPKISDIQEKPKFSDVIQSKNAVFTNVYCDLGLLVSKQQNEWINWPSFTLGRRSVDSSGKGVDASLFIALGDPIEYNLAWAVPKFQFIHYFTSMISKNLSPYYAIGTSFGGIHTRIRVHEHVLEDDGQYWTNSYWSKSNFIGFFGNISLGTEIYRNEKVSGFAQVDVAQPAMGFWVKDPSYFPAIQFRTGVGF